MLPRGLFKTVTSVYTFFWGDVNRKQIFSLVCLFWHLKAFCRIYGWEVPTEKSQYEEAVLLSWRAWEGPYRNKLSVKSEALFDKVGLFFLFQEFCMSLSKIVWWIIPKDLIFSLVMIALVLYPSSVCIYMLWSHCHFYF